MAKPILKINEDGSKLWTVNDILHREDGPALEHYNGSKHWYINGLLHREDAPAIEHPILKEWWINGKQHRLDGPAVEYGCYYKEYWIDNAQYTELEFFAKTGLGN